MERTKSGFKLQSGREIETGYVTSFVFDTFSFDDRGRLQFGYDGFVKIKNSEGHTEYDAKLTPIEKTEIAQYMIQKWAAWAGWVSGIPA